MSYLLAFLFIFGAHAKIIQILHTGDIHSEFKHAFLDPRTGGYARLKTIIDREKKKADEQNIPTILVDVGDFLEGSLFYMVDSGRTSFSLHNSMGYEIVTLGNHDYIMGLDNLNHLLGEVRSETDFTLLAANIDFNLNLDDYVEDPKMMLSAKRPIELLNINNRLFSNIKKRRKFPHLREMILSNFVKSIDDVNICFIGVTSNEKYYKWKFLQEGINIDDPVDTVAKEIDLLKNQGIQCHYTIALTHILLEQDQELAQKHHEIDLIIGGHSFDYHLMEHDIVALDNSRINGNRNGPPIIKTGANASQLGKILIDIHPQKSGNKIISQEFIPVRDVLKDPEIEILVDEAEKKLYGLYDDSPEFDEHLGYFSIGPHDNASYIWSSFVAESMRDITNSDLGINDAHMINQIDHNLQGWFPLTRFDIWNSYPRFFEFEQKHGWYIHVLEIPGIILKKIIKKYLKERPSMTISGLDFNIMKRNGKTKIKDITAKGRHVKDFKNYSVAVPEGIVEGMRNHIKYNYDIFTPIGISPLLDKIGYKTDHTVFYAMERLLKKHREVNACKFYAKSVHKKRKEKSPCDDSNKVYLMNNDNTAFNIRSVFINN
ncbi:MAG: hypothetical protein OXB84_09230, partial [Halobacteriovoraceae bacterium]|nr:hypothetical protein [Halobacteriovoraceae bacterium]